MAMLRTVCDMLGEFWAHIVLFFACVGGTQPICKQRLITEIPDPSDVRGQGEGEFSQARKSLFEVSVHHL